MDNGSNNLKKGDFMTTKHRIYLVRHGETEWNKLGKLQGQTDIPLTEDGMQQARALRAKLEGINFSAAFTSDLSRAKRTAEIVLEGQPVAVIETPLLRESSYGTFEGSHFSEMDAFHKEIIPKIRHLPPIEFLSYRRHEELETFGEVYNRFLSFAQEFVQNKIEGLVLAATHGGVLRAVLEHLDFSHDHHWKIENCAYLVLELEGNQITIVERQGIQH